MDTSIEPSLFVPQGDALDTDKNDAVDVHPHLSAKTRLLQLVRVVVSLACSVSMLLASHDHQSSL